MSMSSSRWWALEKGGDGGGRGEGVSERIIIPSGSAMVVSEVKRRAAGMRGRARGAWSWGLRGAARAVDPASKLSSRNQSSSARSVVECGRRGSWALLVVVAPLVAVATVVAPSRVRTRLAAGRLSTGCLFIIRMSSVGTARLSPNAGGSKREWRPPGVGFFSAWEQGMHHCCKRQPAASLALLARAQLVDAPAVR